jgi:tetratricopeptide (TPR) repeat protein
MSQTERNILIKTRSVIQYSCYSTQKGVEVCCQHPFLTGLLTLVSLVGIIFSLYSMSAYLKQPSPSSLSNVETTTISRQQESLLLLDKIKGMLAKKLPLDAQAKKSILYAVNDLKDIASQDQHQAALQALSQGNTCPAETLLKSFIQTDQLSTKYQAQTYRHLGAFAYLNNRKQAFDAYQRAIELDPNNVNGWNRIATLSKTDNAEAIYQRIIQLKTPQQSQNEIAIAYGNLGVIYKSQGKLNKAINAYQHALTIYQALDNHQGMATQYANLGVISQTCEKLEEARDYYQKLLTLEKHLNHEKGIASAYGSLGAVYQLQGKLENAIEFYQKSLKMSTILGDLKIMANIYGNLGIIYKTRGEIDKAIKHYLQALEINQHLNRTESTASNYSNLGVAFTLKNDKAKAKYYWKKSLQLFQDIKSPTAKTVQSWLNTLKL